MAPQAESASSSSSPSGGLACAIAALAERQQTGTESLTHYNYNIHPNHSSTGLLSLDNHLQMNHDVSEEIGEATFGYDNDDVSNDVSRGHDEMAIVPESYEEQMMLAMAVSLAEARARNSGSSTEVAWS